MNVNIEGLVAQRHNSALSILRAATSRTAKTFVCAICPSDASAFSLSLSLAGEGIYIGTFSEAYITVKFRGNGAPRA